MRVAFLVLTMFFANKFFCQNSIIKGTITDHNTGETMVGVYIIATTINVSITDSRGYYELSLPAGKYKISYRYIGYQSQVLDVNLKPNEVYVKDITLKSEMRELQQVVVSAGRFEQKLSDVSVSMQVVKPSLIEKHQSTIMEHVLEKLPGVEIIDGQANIRNGSGWSYGAGSRVLLMVDDLPLLSADAGDAKWNYLSLENIEQVEIIKGASSALYGSSALNGIINVRTAFPSDKPQVKIRLTSGFYMEPKRKEMIWWDKNPLFGGVNVMLSQRFGNLDIIAGGMAHNDAGYRENNFEERYRGNFKIRYRDKKIKGLLYGINSNFMSLDSKDFFLWIDADSGAWRQKPDDVSRTQGNRINIDPYVAYFDEKGNRHNLKTRYFRTANNYKADKDKNKENSADLFLGEYQFYRSFKNGLDLTAGIYGSYAKSISALYGNHESNNAAIFGQLNKKIKNLNLSMGIRMESFKLDLVTDNSEPVYRAGINYKIFKHTYLRASYGKGYRFPSIAEKYTATSVGGINIFPNPYIGSEKGWSAEVGVIQGLKISEWEGYLDIAAFWTEYQNMMEFVFGFYDTITFKPTTQYFSFRNMGFQSQNIGNARISGFEIILNGKGRIINLPTTFLLGYTYTNPIDMNTDSLYKASKSGDNNILKYRNKHSVKVDFEFGYKKISAGASFIYQSFMENVDYVFVDPILGNLILKGYENYRKTNKTGHAIVDMRLSYNFSVRSSISLLGKNIFNKEYMGRPGDIRPPRNIGIQYLLTL